MIFTGKGIAYTGAYQIADFLIEKKIKGFLFFDFDMTGIRDTLILSESGIELLKKRNNGKFHLQQPTGFKKLCYGHIPPGKQRPVFQHPDALFCKFGPDIEGVSSCPDFDAAF